ncbi:hypothetical protein chiPu_0023546 [Chiloscyllium punctatum]|uniref:Secreted protein n=1 Tax=Chiloscyllium punctatum TaxID=137246 RepID=A0A401TAL9_CHIPU|nr:hypothetical protein [Chiloscyllium punctatum]
MQRLFCRFLSVVSFLCLLEANGGISSADSSGQCRLRSPFPGAVTGWEESCPVPARKPPGSTGTPETGSHPRSGVMVIRFPVKMVFLHARDTVLFHR